jgi:hypothetical protein
MLLTASSFVYQIHLPPLRSRSLVGAPIHFAVQSDRWSRPVGGEAADGQRSGGGRGGGRGRHDERSTEHRAGECA